MCETTIRPARTDEVDALADCLAAAFDDDPYSRSLFGDGGDRLARARSLFGAQLRFQYLPEGLVEVAEVDGDLAGVSLWSRPDSDIGTLVQQARMASVHLRVLGFRLPVAIYGEVQASRRHPRFPHWYLYLLGVAPQFQGQGIGGTLLRHRLNQFGAHEACYLEATSKDSSLLYARYGFIPMGPVPLGTGEDTLGMWRPADQGIGDAFDR